MYINRFSRKADRSHSDARFEIHTIDSFLQEMTSGNLPLDIVKKFQALPLVIIFNNELYWRLNEGLHSKNIV
jgi:hypothetical protein